MTIARMSSLSKTFKAGYPCQNEWPADCFVQAGDGGIVLCQKGGTYRTAFFEAFPRKPNTFIRGEGATVEEAEASCWAQWQKIVACAGHEFERRGYHNGYGFCTRCGLGGMVFEPDVFCCICGRPTYFTTDTREQYYCEDHQRDKPLEFWTGIDWDMVEHDRWKFDSYGVIGPLTEADIERGEINRMAQDGCSDLQ